MGQVTVVSSLTISSPIILPHVSADMFHPDPHHTHSSIRSSTTVPGVSISKYNRNWNRNRPMTRLNLDSRLTIPIAPPRCPGVSEINSRCARPVWK